MSRTTMQWAHCKIENSGFSSERRFEMSLPDGGKIVGAAYIDYLRTTDNKPIGEDWPAYGQTEDGFVQCRVVKQEGSTAWVEFPGTEIFHVPREALTAQ